jgi:hypothetical protein
MSDEANVSRQRYPEWIFFIIGMFFFFTLVGAIFAYIPTLQSDLQAFFLNFNMATVPNSNGLILPAPATPGLFTDVYWAAEVFCIAWGIFSIFTLGLRTAAGSAPWRKAETISGMFWWFGASYLISIFLTASTTLIGWFTFWTTIIMLFGGSLIMRGLVIAAFR